MVTTEAYNRKSAMIDLKKFNFSRNGGDSMEITEWKNGEDYTVSVDAGDQNAPFDITIEEPDLIY